jgi:hypothetical protein
MRAFLAPLTCLAVAVLVPLVPARARASAARGPYSLDLLGEDGRTLPTFSKDGRTYLLGSKGERYSVRIRNQSGSRVEFVASVDGRDVLDGSPANWSKRGYIVNPWDQVVIDGFRLDENRVAAFRFGAVRDSYAAQMGDARDVGVIGVAVFAERQLPAAVEEPSRRRFDLSAPQPPAAAPSGAGADDAARSEMADSKAAQRKDRAGLGTEFGESRWSHVNQVNFERASNQPGVVLGLRYNDRAGLRAMGVNLRPYPDATEADVRETAQPFRGNYCTPPAGWNR